ncbi:hypothetical protein [Asticcacaulis biprosthecium]|nr:hypothetical protein [Asticcacaulis biprosthecium]
MVDYSYVELYPLPASEVAAGRERRAEGMKLAEIENNPLTAEDVAMFDMFDREAWSVERRLAYIKIRATTLAK